MQFDHDYLMELANQFEKKAEQLLETAESIRETASIMAPAAAAKHTSPPPPEPTPSPKPPPVPELPLRPSEIQPQPSYAPVPPIKREPPNGNVRNDNNNSKPLSDDQPTFSPLEKHVLDSLESHIAGLSINKIVGYCKQQGSGTNGSVQFAIGKLVKSGHITRLQRGRYALPTAFNKTIEEAN
jgi:hypothetical protein